MVNVDNNVHDFICENKKIESCAHIVLFVFINWELFTLLEKDIKRWA